ncbi:hypothetical protein GCM10010393_19290 [Streptomyces gobitricini]|uniref:Uncharacterized protein n=1 Tax=Streptomyces gobitricini TaxID=68211 RepID=A0ABP5YW58_9ACTN
MGAPRTEDQQAGAAARYALRAAAGGSGLADRTGLTGCGWAALGPAPAAGSDSVMPGGARRASGGVATSGRSPRPGGGRDTDSARLGKPNLRSE